jgi:glycerate 2-kinase
MAFPFPYLSISPAFNNLMEKGLQKLRSDALTIFRAALEAVDPERSVLTHLERDGQTLLAGGERLELSERGRVFVVGAGKAAGPMAAAAEKVLGNRIVDGVVVTKYGHGRSLERIRLLEAGHPVPDENGIAAAGEIIAILEKAGADDLIICLISGGGSALLPAPVEGVSLADKMAVTRLLLECGADIGEINTVRKHLSRLKGGGLARLAAPARLLTLILSDVVGDPLEVIASGPTAADPTTFDDALLVLDRYGLREEVPLSVLRRLERGVAGVIPETLKPGDPAFGLCCNLLVGNNAMAVAEAARSAEGLGYRPLILSATVTGEARHVAAVHGAMAREIIASGNPVPAPACLISGGETTVTVRGKGRGGRNQEFALAAALEIRGLPGVLVFSAGTDGTDGPTDAAGAMADGTTCERAEKAGLDPLRHLGNNDSYTFFRALDDLVVTGPTGTNVMDLRLVLVGKL